MPPRILAVDWSGALSGAERRLWVAEFSPAARTLVRLECGRSREQLVAHLLEEVVRDPQVVIGLDFAFSMPAWFAHARGARDIDALWALVEREGEAWLTATPPPFPFWGRPGSPRPEVPAHFRRTEEMLPAVAGIRPKSVLQIGGAGSVGTGSIRGMPHLRTLRAAGCAVWPFDAPRLPLVVEIYPRLLTGPVAKGDVGSRRRYLAAQHPTLAPALRALAGSCEDAFDAAVSALAMGAVAGRFLSLGCATDEVEALEGAIWQPDGRGWHGS